MALREALRRISRRPEARHVGVMMSGAMAAQLLLVASTPLLARLYGPDAFGIFALLLTVTTIGGSVGGLCYEVAIILPRSERTARALLALSLMLSMAMAGIVTGALAALVWAFPAPWNEALNGTFYLSCFAATALATQYNALGYAHSRAGQFGAVAASKVALTGLTAVAQIGLALLGSAANGLLLGRALGSLGSVAHLARNLPRGFDLRGAFQVGWRAIAVAAKTYRDFLIHVPRQLLVRGTSMLPAALLLAAYGPAAAGFYFFAARLVERPGMMLGDSLSRVPMKQFADRRKNRQKLVRAVVLYTLALGAPVVAGVALLAFIAEPVFRILFGAAWEPAAPYAVVLAGWAAIRLATLPLGTLTSVLRIQRYSFYADAAFSLRVLIIPAMAARGADALEAIAAFCAVSIVYHLTVSAIGLFAAVKHDREIARESRTPPSQSFEGYKPGEIYG